MSFTKSYTEKEIMLKVPARITSFAGGATTIYTFKGDSNTRLNIDWEKNIVEVIVTQKDDKARR